ncbi:hypothetical protein Dimus_022857 [Dionaea muscipula]
MTFLKTPSSPCMKQLLRGNLAQERSFMMLRIRIKALQKCKKRFQRRLTKFDSVKEQTASGVDPSCPTGRIPEAELLKFQAEFERKRANRFHDELEKAKAENAGLQALLHQAQSKPHP